MFFGKSMVEQLRYTHANKHLIGKSLSACVTLASSVGTLAELGRQHVIKQERADQIIGSIQVGEYIMTGEIPKKDLVESVMVIQ